MQQASRSTDTGWAQKGDSEPGHLLLVAGNFLQINQVKLASHGKRLYLCRAGLAQKIGSEKRLCRRCPERIVAVVPADQDMMPANRYDTVGVAPLIERIEFGALLADKAFDSNWIIKTMNARGAKIVISQRPQRLQPFAIHDEMYKWRHLIENYFQKLKEFKRIARRSLT